MKDLSFSKVKRVSSTDLCDQWISKLREKHGALMFYQSGGCCEGSAPICMLQGEMRIGDSDVLLGIINNCQFYMSGSQFEKWRHTHILVDVIEGGGNGFSLESPESVSFHMLSRIFDEQERDLINKEKLENSL